MGTLKACMIQVAHGESVRGKEDDWKDCAVRGAQVGEHSYLESGSARDGWDSGHGRESCERMESLVSHAEPVQTPFSHRLEFPGEGNIARRVATTPLRSPCHSLSAASSARALQMSLLVLGD